ncbi:MAG: DUF4249 domain-containing protein [Bacteroidota bacterium]
MKKHIYLLVLGLLWLYSSCVDPVEPEFNFKDGLIFVDAFALSEPGTSIVTIQQSEIDNDRFRLRPISEAVVHFENMDSGELITLNENGQGTYAPTYDFFVKKNERWLLKIQLADGTSIQSSVETVKSSVPIDQVTATYSPEVVFDQDRDKFVPGHKVFIDWTDPADEENYYLWISRSFEPLHVCLTCERGHYRNDRCTPFDGAPPFFSYLCDTMCWQIRHSTSLQIQDDRLINGTTVTNKEITTLKFFRKEDILVQVQQLSLSVSAYNYFKSIASITNEGGGLNAPPPAGLLGNLFNPDDSEAPILGQFTAGSVATKSLYIERENITENPLTPDQSVILEDCDFCPNYYPCEETRFRTSIKPEGWQ